jgi:hypothetical protein
MKDEGDRLVHEVMIEQMFFFDKGEKLRVLKLGENEGTNWNFRTTNGTKHTK